MELKTRITADEGRADLLITREFDLPVGLLFRAHAEAGLVAQWMNTRVVKLESRKHGSWEYETSNPQGEVVFRAHGTIHDFVPNEKITRTFEMENAPFGVQLEFLEFESLTEEASRLVIHTVFRTPELRDEMLRLPFAYGLNMAHNKLQEMASNLK